MVLFIRGIVTLAIIITATFLPFVAGGYDPLAKPLSAIAWMLGRFGLMLVPIGGLWLWAGARGVPDANTPHWLAVVTLGAFMLISLATILISFASGMILAIATALTVVFLAVRFIRRLRAKQSELAIPKAVAVLLSIGSIVLFGAQWMLATPLASYARNHVIQNSTPLIAEIERYRERNGMYPVSLFSLYGDYKPGIVGVQRYYYEAAGDSYNVIFEEPSLGFGTRRFVVYNPLDQQRLTVHESDRLILSDAERDADNAGYTLIESLPQPHWKAFLFLS